MFSGVTLFRKKFRGVIIFKTKLIHKPQSFTSTTNMELDNLKSLLKTETLYELLKY